LNYSGIPRHTDRQQIEFCVGAMAIIDSDAHIACCSLTLALARTIPKEGSNLRPKPSRRGQG
jgi:hypothetical protein